jgi:hypothetical protein
LETALHIQLSESSTQPVIILQDDHGLIDHQDHWTRMADLNTYFFPDQEYSELYPQITPVNSFRVLFTQSFGQEYPLLEDNPNYSITCVDQTFELIPFPCVVS